MLHTETDLRGQAVTTAQQHAARQAAAWLEATHPQPHSVRSAWDADVAAVVMLPAGVRWDAVRLPESVVQLVATSENPEQVRAMLAELEITGPVLRDPSGHVYYVLVPPGSAAAWRHHQMAPCLGNACHIATPHPEKVARPGLHWVQPPDGSGELSSPAAVRALLAVAVGPRGGVQ